MLELYVRDNCAYSAAVLHALEESKIHLKVHNTGNNRYALELIERGGKYQVPALYDGKNKEMIYESGRIMDYLETGGKGLQ
jgi:glutaredoxin